MHMGLRFFSRKNMSMQKFMLALALLLALAAAQGAGTEAGKAKAQACAACHGERGITTMANTPHIAGQPEAYIADQLRAYRSGKRVHPVMQVIAKPLTDEDIASLAAFYSSVKIKVDGGS
jgi:cytochrome c553